MDSKKFQRLTKLADEFGEIAKKVNKASKLRKNHSENAIRNSDFSNRTSAQLLREIQSIAKENLALRNKYNILISTCKILTTNLNNQFQLIKDLKILEAIKPQLAKKIVDANKKLSNSLKKGIIFIDKIITINNVIILMDNLIIMRKRFQKERMRKLKKSTAKILEDSNKALAGSHSNINRGIALANRLKDFEKIINTGNKNKIEKLIDESKTGWKLAKKVNRNSKTQFQFAEQVNLFTKLLHNESLLIKELIMEKIELFNGNLEPIAEIAVLVAVELHEYLSANEYISELALSDTTMNKIELGLLNDLAAHINSACNDVEMIMNLNYDMTDNISANANLEEQTVELTKQEIELFEAIKDETEAMTEATQYPVKGSAKNIKNGQEMETILREIFNAL